MTTEQAEMALEVWRRVMTIEAALEPFILLWIASKFKRYKKALQELEECQKRLKQVLGFQDEDRGERDAT